MYNLNIPATQKPFTADEHDELPWKKQNENKNKKDNFGFLFFSQKRPHRERRQTLLVFLFLETLFFCVSVFTPPLFGKDRHTQRERENGTWSERERETHTNISVSKSPRHVKLKPSPTLFSAVFFFFFFLSIPHSFYLFISFYFFILKRGDVRDGRE